uniref:DNA 5'-3' helicase n=1 Tax=Rhodomela confervoides TaxID=35163 RepID=A0A1Z1MA27_RHOCN|nr:Replication helicase subunit [Rhodomela confervoides]ARW62773.1 Replication helicase subunit [Rhodomela confervoides]
MSELYKNKFIPQNYLAEEILIGILLIYPNIFNSVTDIIKKDFFFLESNQIIYLNLLEIHKNRDINIVTLFYQLESNKLFKKIGGLKNLMKMMKQSQVFMCSSNKNNYTEELIKLINSSYIRRLLIQYGHNVIKIGYIGRMKNQYIYHKILSYLNFTEKEVGNSTNNNVLEIKNLVSKQLIEIKYQKVYTLKNIKNEFLKSGFTELDNIISGLPDGNLIIIAGRPSIGKTSLAINIAYNVFFNQKISVSIFSLEMSSKEIVNKLISIASKAELNETTINNLDKKQWKSITSICFKLLSNNIYINDKDSVEISDIEYIAKKLKKKDQRIRLIIIDYLQLIGFSLETNKKYNRSQELGYITRKLKLLAQFLQIPIVVLSQLNRNIEARTNKEPLLSDLKESGCIQSRTNINIFNNLINEINISSIRTYLNSVTYKSKNNYKTKIHIFQKYIFKCQAIKIKILLTSNHSYLSQIKWIKLNQILLSTTINRKELKRCYFILKKHVKQIIFDNYYKSYDVNKNSNFSLVCKSIIIHNSIEQDADIILMLYKRKEEIDNSREEKTINIKIAKNRNGISGSCKMLFIPKTNAFRDISTIEIN